MLQEEKNFGATDLAVSLLLRLGLLKLVLGETTPM